MFEVIVPPALRLYPLRRGKAAVKNAVLSYLWKGGNGVKVGEGAAVEGWKRLSGKTMGILAGVPW